ncbi:hypothetical protein BABINDRAFT_8235 [Babjeviella inositovora NRRL Y-12698]|uniref:Letm1 RBD domain-containing protein n=1 Tax=Babjeviella inositovora NRRL Y-12698 TaxID=984486 RepID=A0A1E3QSR6_9ASCO|nr:uncharacterized protein BABINDRAFT_8235 [Babjeviella inositovora NRRL Y-12698]ODQ80062.1 hypothetical protein BABINDRAFT_8235 [Babjeviella inositovora NRRL Y-12698]
MLLNIARGIPGIRALRIGRTLSVRTAPTARLLSIARYNYSLNTVWLCQNRYNSSVATPPTPEPKESKLTQIWAKVKHEAQHYWNGTKLLGLEMKISSKLVFKMVKGYGLSRREYKQLERTTTDIIRLIPFSMFVIIPFAEILLPFALKLFPNLLPSTYQTAGEKEKKLALLRKSRKDVARTLNGIFQKTKFQLPSTVTDAEKLAFQQFFATVRDNDANVALTQDISREQLILVARLFKDDVVLDNLSRDQLVALAKYIQLNTFGSQPQLLRYRIRHKMLTIKNDDKAIDYEGVESLTLAELQAACAMRGMKVVSVQADKLKANLQSLLDLRLHEKIPSTLLLLSTAYAYRTDGPTASTEDVDTLYDALAAVLSSIPVELYHETALNVNEVGSTEHTAKKMAVLKEQEELIKSESSQSSDDIHIQVKDKLNLDEEVEAKEVEAPKEEK